jgi:catechol 2,3-dioxygenase-like lactoylglutathione lyase family enzyme
MDNVGIVVESLDAAISFFAELGLELEGRATIEGDWAERVTGLRHMRVEIAMMRTPDGHSRLEISRFLTPPAVADHRNAPVNALGYLRIMFAVEDIDDTLVRLRPHGAELIGELAQYEDKCVRALVSSWTTCSTDPACRWALTGQRIRRRARPARRGVE